MKRQSSIYNLTWMGRNFDLLFASLNEIEILKTLYHRKKLKTILAVARYLPWALNFLSHLDSC